MEAHDDYLMRRVRTKLIPISYVTKVDKMPTIPVTIHAKDQLHVEKFALIEEDLIAQASHTCTLYCDNNTDVYFCPEETTRRMQYAASIKLFKRAKKGRRALKLIKDQYAGDDKWQAKLALRDKFLQLAELKGQSLFLLERFIGQHRGAFRSIGKAAVHASFQLPNKFTQVGFLLSAIKYSNASSQAAVAKIKSDALPKSAMSKRHHFKLAMTYLLPF
eukprot:1772018-Ditylum_brightwellii.AAC.2